MAFASQLRTRKIDSTVNSTPATKIAPRAVCHGKPIPFTTVNAMNAFSPMYGAMANGRLAYTPITSVPKAAEMIVAVTEASRGMPAASRIAGFTMMMYAIVRKVAMPAIVSRR
ncbi:MAG: hypothetical protein U5K74_12035 [Gemmatimonadaceae bacterium]|nr:hypothetical protein [Gemmatimonadaceae bacterium]